MSTPGFVDWFRVIDPWTRRANDPVDGPFITDLDAQESLEALRLFLDDWFLFFDGRVSTLENAPQGQHLVFRGRAQDAASIPDTTPDIGDLWVDNYADHTGWLWVGNKWTEVRLGKLPGSLRFRGTVADGAALPANVPNPQDGDLAITNNDQHLWSFENGRWTDNGPVALTAPPTAPGGTVTVTATAGQAQGPAGAVAGDLLLNTTDKKTYVYNGTAWIELPSAAAVPVPLAGDTGKVLTAQAGAMVWGDPARVPVVTVAAGGAGGHAFATPPVDGDWYFDSATKTLSVRSGGAWVSVAALEIPPVALQNAGDLLVVDDPAAGTLLWVAPPEELPDVVGVADGTVLTVNAADPLGYVWAQPPSQTITATPTPGVTPATYTPALTPKVGDTFINLGDVKQWAYSEPGPVWTLLPQPVGVPSGGTDGQALTRDAAGDLAWADMPKAQNFRGAVTTTADLGTIPTPQPGDLAITTTDQVLHVYGGTPAAWNSIGPATTTTGIPAGGAAGQVLAKQSATDQDVIWSSLPSATQLVPSGGTSGAILGTNPTTGAPMWVMPQSHQLARYRGHVATVQALAGLTSPVAGDFALVTADGHLHLYDGTAWNDVTGLSAASGGTATTQVVGGSVTPWTAQAYPQDAVVERGGKWYVARNAATAGDVPGAAAVWRPLSLLDIWHTARGSALPAGGLPGQGLVKTGPADGAVGWAYLLPPTGGHAVGDALTITDPATAALAWQAPAGGGGAPALPAGGTPGQVLGYGPNGQLAWINPPAGTIPLQPGQTATGGQAALAADRGAVVYRADSPPTSTDGKDGDHWVTTSGQHYIKRAGHGA